MKKRHLLSVAVLFSSMLGFAQNTLSMDAVKIAPGKTAQVSVNLKNSTAYTAFQFDVTLPEGITVKDATLNETRATNHTLKTGTVDGKYRVLAYSYDDETKKGNTPLEGSEGAIVNLTLEAGESVAEGAATIVIDAGNPDQEGGQVFVEADGTTNYSMAEVTAAVTVSNGEVITIGESGKTTFVCSSGLDFTDNEVKAYVVTGIDAKNVWMTRISKVPANTPIVVKGSEGDHTIPTADIKGADYKSFLIGNNTDVAINVTPEGSDQFLRLGTKGFSKFTDTKSVGAHKAYIRAKALPAAKAGSSVPVSIGSGLRTSLCADVDLDFSDSNVRAYIAIGYDGTIWLTRVMTASAGTPLYLRGEQGDYSIPSNATQTVYANMLVGNNTEETIEINATDGEYTNYFVGTSGFSKVKTTRNVSAHKSYLQILTSCLPAEARGISDGDMFIGENELEVLKMPIAIFGEDGDEATGIRAIEEIQNNTWYNLKGQRIDTPTRKGLYIKNGKKVVVK